MGYTTRSFPELPTNISRPTVFGKDVLYGRTTYAPGYDWVFTLARRLVFRLPTLFAVGRRFR